MTKKLIGYEACRQDLIKEEYRQFANLKDCDLVAIHMYYDDEAKYGIVVELHDWFYSNHEMWYPKMTEEEQNSFTKRNKA